MIKNRAACFIFFAMTALASFRAGPPGFAETKQEKLRTLKQKILDQEQEILRLDKTKAQQAAQAHEAHQKLLAVSSKVNIYEKRAEELETEKKRLEAQRDTLLKELQVKTESTSVFLAALERIVLYPPAALILRDMPPDEIVRSAVILKTLIPESVARTTDLQKTLQELLAQTQGIVLQERELEGNNQDLLKAKDALTQTYGELQGRLDTLKNRFAELQQNAAALQRQVHSLEDLMKNLEKTAKKRGALEPLLQEEALGVTPQTLRPEVLKQRLAEKNAFSIRFARHHLKWPAVGRQGPPPHPSLKGITIQTKPGAQVTAPWAGLVEHIGDIPGYGHIIALYHDYGFRTMIGGAGEILVQKGQTVMTGEILAFMPKTKNPRIYLELRQEGRPIPMLLWLESP